MSTIWLNILSHHIVNIVHIAFICLSPEYLNGRLMLPYYVFYVNYVVEYFVSPNSKHSPHSIYRFLSPEYLNGRLMLPNYVFYVHYVVEYFVSPNSKHSPHSIYLFIA
jgi:hypothetical protein